MNELRLSTRHLPAHFTTADLERASNLDAAAPRATLTIGTHRSGAGLRDSVDNHRRR
jgi:hypothetical protein